MANPDRLSALDATFLHLEDGTSAHMHVASVMLFEGPAPSQEELVEHVLDRMDLVPRYRQRLAFVPLGQGRPVWVDDPYFNPEYHVRHTALPSPGDDDQLRRLAGRLFSQRLDRSRPLWEIWLVEGLAGGRFALVGKTHHALVDGISGVDITTVLFDTDPEPALPPRSSAKWSPRPVPTTAQLLSQALLERSTVPGEMARGVRALTRGPRQAATELRDRLGAVGALAWAGLNSASPSPLNVPIGPHRRYTWVDADLDRFRAMKTALGGTLNDVVLTAVTLALGRFLRAEGYDTDGLALRAMVPVSVRADVERGALGNRVAAMFVPLPVGVESPRACFERLHTDVSRLKESGQAVGAEVLTQLAGFAPTTILSQAARLQARQRFFNLVITNVPGPQIPLYLLGRRMQAIYPVVPLAENQALGVAVLSYAGGMGFGLLGDYDAMPGLEALGTLLEGAIEDLAAAALLSPRVRPARRSPRRAPRAPRAPASAGEGTRREPTQVAADLPAPSGPAD
jgi:WS/DGAT/MGAT family acyltransferase